MVLITTAQKLAQPHGQSSTDAKKKMKLCPSTTPTTDVIEYRQSFATSGCSNSRCSGVVERSACTAQS